MLILQWLTSCSPVADSLGELTARGSCRVYFSHCLSIVSWIKNYFCICTTSAHKQRKKSKSMANNKSTNKTHSESSLTHFSGSYYWLVMAGLSHSPPPCRPLGEGCLRVGREHMTHRGLCPLACQHGPVKAYIRPQMVAPPLPGSEVCHSLFVGMSQ